jgi:hypothetical protein
MRRLAKFAAPILSLVLLPGCASYTVPALIDTGALCKDWRVIKPSKTDILTDKTAKDILDSNEARHRVYGCSRLENEAVTT